MKLYSPSTGGFYDTNETVNAPEDARPLSDERYNELKAAERTGMEIKPNQAGDPIAIAPAWLQPKTAAQIRAEMQCASWQLRRALTQLGLRDAVEAAVSAADQDTKDMWEYTAVHHRNHPIVSALAASINKTDADIDALFELAITIQE